MTKTEALEKALERAGGIVKIGLTATIKECNGYFDVSDDHSGGQIFRFTPPREAPAKGTIVEVWDDDNDERRLRYSYGELSPNGYLLTCEATNRTPATLWTNWRVVGEGERVTELIFHDDNGRPVKVNQCYKCTRAASDNRSEECATCTTTRPSNWEGGGE
jgi:hypothetical protein